MDDIGEIKEGIENLGNKIDSVENTINIYQQTIGTLSSLDAKYTNLTEKNNVYIAELTETLEIMKGQLTQLETGLSDGKTVIETYNSTLEKYNKELESITTTIGAMGEDLKGVRTDLDTFFIDAEGDRTNIAVITYSLLENTYQLLESSVKDLKSNYGKIQTQYGEIEKKLDGISGDVGKGFTDTQGQISGYRGDVQDLEDIFLGEQTKENIALALQGENTTRVIEASHGKEASDNSITKDAMLFFTQFADRTGRRTYMSNQTSRDLIEVEEADNPQSKYLEANEAARSIMTINQALKDGLMSKEEAKFVKEQVTGDIETKTNV